MHARIEAGIDAVRRPMVILAGIAGFAMAGNVAPVLADNTPPKPQLGTAENSVGGNCHLITLPNGTMDTCVTLTYIDQHLYERETDKHVVTHGHDENGDYTKTTDVDRRVWYRPDGHWRLRRTSKHSKKVYDPTTSGPTAVAPQA